VSAARHPRIVVVGDIGVDVLVAPHMPAVTGADVPARIRTEGGGAGANTAAWLAHLGAEVTLVARVGADAAGSAAVAELAAAGVLPAVTVDPDAPTCTVVVLVEDGDRTMLSDRGAAARLQPADLPALDGADHLHLSGYVLLDPSSRDAGLAMLAAARAAGLTTSVDPQSAGLITDPDAFVAALAGVDLLLPNLDELEVLAGSRDPAGATALLGSFGAVAVTMGAAGASWVDGSGITSVPAAPGSCVDSTGAGDAFDAGLLTAWLAGKPVPECLAAGVRLGALAVSQVGAQPATSRR
jgi:sugar/nucleoside kinase (ribokinase family)